MSISRSHLCSVAMQSHMLSQQTSSSMMVAVHLRLGRYIVAGLSANVTLQSMRVDPQLREVFLVRDGRQWRPPRVNETCCRRPRLAALLRAGPVTTTLHLWCSHACRATLWQFIVEPDTRCANCA